MFREEVQRALLGTKDFSARVKGGVCLLRTWDLNAEDLRKLERNKSSIFHGGRNELRGRPEISGMKRILEE